MKDRAMQALYLLAFEPLAEMTADPHSYGFRKERCCQDAIHVDKAKRPSAMRELLEDFRQHEFVPFGVRQSLQSEAPDRSDGEDFER